MTTTLSPEIIQAIAVAVAAAQKSQGAKGTLEDSEIKALGLGMKKPEHPYVADRCPSGFSTIKNSHLNSGDLEHAYLVTKSGICVDPEFAKDHVDAVPLDEAIKSFRDIISECSAYVGKLYMKSMKERDAKRLEVSGPSWSRLREARSTSPAAAADTVVSVFTGESADTKETASKSAAGENLLDDEPVESDSAATTVKGPEGKYKMAYLTFKQYKAWKGMDDASKQAHFVALVRAERDVLKDSGAALPSTKGMYGKRVYLNDIDLAALTDDVRNGKTSSAVYMLP